MTLSAKIAAAILRACGWRVAPLPSPPPKALILVYPHTSNWDFPIGILARTVFQLRISWVGKHTLFRWPLGAPMRALGGIPIDRTQSAGLVKQLQSEFERQDTLYIAITPEGTRRRTAYWKSGFYHLARQLDIPVGLTYIDYAQREVAIAQWLRLSGDVERDLQTIRDVYRGHQGKFPALMGDIKFKD